jgi:hypothetical protein
VGKAGTKTAVIAGNHDDPARLEAWGMLAELVDIATVARPRAAESGRGHRVHCAVRRACGHRRHSVCQDFRLHQKSGSMAGQIPQCYRVREDLYYGSDTSTLPANSGTVIQSITSPKGDLIVGPWQNTEYYLSVGQGFTATICAVR